MDKSERFIVYFSFVKYWKDFLLFSVTCRAAGTFFVCVVVRILETGSHLLLALGIESNAESRFLSTTITTTTRRGHKRLARLQIFHFIHLFSYSFLFVGDFFFVFAGFKFFKLPGRRAGKCFMI